MYLKWFKADKICTVSDDNFEVKLFHKFHWSVKTLENSLPYPKLLLQIYWNKSCAFTMIGEINPIGFNIELTRLSIPLLVSRIFLLTTLKFNISELGSQDMYKALLIDSSSWSKFTTFGDKCRVIFLLKFHGYWKQTSLSQNH